MKKISILKFCLFLTVVLFSKTLFSQNYSQTVKGNVIDLISEVPLPGANVLILESTPSIRAITDAEGNFKLENVPIGRYDIQVTYLGYKIRFKPKCRLPPEKKLYFHLKCRKKLIRLVMWLLQDTLRKTNL